MLGRRTTVGMGFKKKRAASIIKYLVVQPIMIAVRAKRRQKVNHVLERERKIVMLS